MKVLLQLPVYIIEREKVNGMKKKINRKTNARKYFWVSDNNNSIFSTCQCNIEAPGIVQKANTLEDTGLEYISFDESNVNW